MTCDQDISSKLKTEIVTCGLAGLLFLHTGLALLEAGRSRHKNTATVLTKHITCLLFSILVYWIGGHALAYGKTSFFVGSLYGTSDETFINFLIHALLSVLPSSLLSGAVAERSHFTGHLTVSVLSSLIIYPFTLRWFVHPDEYGTAWFRDRYVTDLNSVLPSHVLSGAIALVACLIHGRRMEKFGDQHRETVTGHSLPLAYIGTILISVGLVGKTVWFSVNSEISVVAVLVNCLLSASFSGTLASILNKIGMMRRKEYGVNAGSTNRTVVVHQKKWSFYAVAGATLAGLVGISGGCGLYPTWVAVIIGLVSAVLYIISIQLVQLFRIDDTTEVISINLLPGIWSVLAVPAFRQQIYGGPSVLMEVRTALTAGEEAGWTAIACIATITWGMVASFVIFAFLLLIRKLRVSINIETTGSDAFKIIEQAYSKPGATKLSSGGQSFTHFESPGFPILSDERIERKSLAVPPNGSRSVSCTAVVSQAGPLMTSTQKLPSCMELKELSKTVPTIIVEETSGTISDNCSNLAQPPPPPPYKSSTDIRDTGSVPPPPPLSATSTQSLNKMHDKDSSVVVVVPPAPPSTPELATQSDNTLKLDMDELRITLKQQKKRLKSTGRSTGLGIPEHLRCSVTSIESNRSIKSHVIRDLASNNAGFSYLVDSAKKVCESSAEKKSLADKDNSPCVSMTSDDMMNVTDQFEALEKQMLDDETSVNEKVKIDISRYDPGDITYASANFGCNESADLYEDQSQISEDQDPNNNIIPSMYQNKKVQQLTRHPPVPSLTIKRNLED